jgi:hypothetical protein
MHFLISPCAQVKSEFLSADGKVISKSSQPCMLKFKSPHKVHNAFELKIYLQLLCCNGPGATDRAGNSLFCLGFEVTVSEDLEGNC